MLLALFQLLLRELLELLLVSDHLLKHLLVLEEDLSREPWAELGVLDREGLEPRWRAEPRWWD